MPNEESIFDLPKERLELIDHDIYKWLCCAEGCTNGTHVWDYGEFPRYFFPRRVNESPWLDSRYRYWLCGKHWKMEKRNLRFAKKAHTNMAHNLVFVKSVTASDIKFKL